MRAVLYAVFAVTRDRGYQYSLFTREQSTTQDGDVSSKHLIKERLEG